MIARKAADGLTITDVNFSIRSKVAIDWLNEKGYRIAAVRHETSAVPESEKETAVVAQTPEKKVAAATPEPQKETAIAPAQPEKQMETPQQGQILTEKKPYRMDELLEGIREMEDLMDEMKDMIDDFKERRKK